jgi:transposase
MEEQRMGFITNNREQISFIGYSLDDFVSKDAKCRFVAQLVSELDLQGLYDGYSEQGNDAFDPETMLGTWFFAYSEGVTSTRKLEERCRRDLHFIYVSANLRPDHSSLSRFRKRHLGLIPEYFVQIVRRAGEKGLMDFNRIAIDGTKIQASASAKRSKDSESLERYLAAVRKDITEYMHHCDELDEDEDTRGLEEVREKLSRLHELEKRLSDRKEQLGKRKETVKAEYRDSHKVNITEPDAVMMDKVNGRKKVPAYNAQLSVDTKTQMICANDVVQDRNDQQQFARQHKKVEEVLGKDAQREYITDAGYHSLEQLEYVETNHVDAIIADPYPKHRARVIEGKETPQGNSARDKEKFDRSDFVFHEDGDYYECPAGGRLYFERRYHRADWHGRTYKADNCGKCSLKDRCLPKNNNSAVRRIHRDDREPYAEQMFDRLQSEWAKDLLKIRSKTVEPAIGNMKENLGFRRFRLRGLQQVRAEFNLMCIAHNINKMYALLLKVLIAHGAIKSLFHWARNHQIGRIVRLMQIRTLIPQVC